MNIDDAMAIGMMRAGTSDAFSGIIERYQAPIFRYLFRLTGDYELSRDLTQDTFMNAYEAILKTRGDLNLKAWLYKIATNAAYKHFRRSKVLSFFSLESHGSKISAEEQDIPECIAVQEAIAVVPFEMRTCLVMHLVDGFKYREIALTLGISEDAVRMRVARGKQAFIEFYEGRKKDAV